MRSVQDHLQACLAAVGQLPPLAVQLPDAVGCILAEDVRAPSDLPVTDLAALDGYAVRSDDVAAASARPVRLRVVDDLRAGDTDVVHLVDGAVVRLASGAPLPVGADAVVPLEATDQGDATVTVLRAVVAGENVR
ncbi:MAG: molybdopterin molybdenumtransferase MoeA, partial [Actinobacteria bacterium]|nr:molybdopterin molybdenumtransferase MoeA [Actinomycetota bacterium]